MNRRQFMIASAAGVMSLGPAWRALAQATTRQSFAFLTDVPEIDGNVLLARPTDHSITLSLRSAVDRVARVRWGMSGEAMSNRTPVIHLRAGESQAVVLDRLTAGRAYAYELIDEHTSKPLFADHSAGRFHTARAAGESFTFTIQADSHLDDGCRADIYARTLDNQLADAPDFMIDMGDTSMAGKHPSRESALKQYAAQRYHLGRIGHSVPAFLVLGNHDGEEAKLRGATEANGLAVWSNAQRKQLLPNPEPDAFYRGNDQPHRFAGLLQNYYAWTWADALLVVLDPYWTSTSKRGSSGGWHMSLGRTQYDWLAETLRASRARHKLVFIHQLVGGLDDAGRGGAEAARCFEWGGQEIDGKNTFAQNRPGWAMPVHQLLRETHVRAVFHGHDHFFADQVVDGIHYVLAPQAAHRNYKSTFAAEYHYVEGDFLPNSGHLRVKVSPERVTVDYVRSVPPGVARNRLKNASVDHTITIG